MEYFIHFIAGYSTGFVALILPGMLNMTAVRTKIEKNRNSALLFVLGAALVVIPQVYIALAFTKYFARHPEIVEKLKIGGIFVLFTMSIFFFTQARKKFKGEGSKRRGNYLFIGMLLSAMNMLSIPFYLLWSAVLESEGWLILEQPYINLFVGGVFLGTITLFLIYVAFASVIERKIQFIARNINYILSILLFALGILVLFNV